MERPRDAKGRYIKVTKAEKKESRIVARSGVKPKSNLAHQFATSGKNHRGKSGISFAQLRNLSRANNIVRVAVNSIKHSVTRIPYFVRAKDFKRTEELKEQIDYVTNLLRKPNDNNDTFRTLFEMVAEDILVTDQGVIEKVRNSLGQIVELYYVDGATIKPRIDELGLLGSPAYNQYLDGAEGVGKPDAEFEKEDLLVMQVNPQGEVGRLGYGMSPVESIVMTVITSIESMVFNSKYFDESKLPPYMANLKGVPTEELIAFKEAFEAQLNGKPWAGAFTNADSLDIKLLRPSNQEMQFYELSLWLARIIFASFEVSSEDFGFTQDSNRATAEVSHQMSKERGVQNLLEVISERINLQIIGDLAQTDEKFAGIEFAWDVVDKADAKEQAEMDEIYLRNGVKTVNEIRVRDGLEKIDGGDEPKPIGIPGFTMPMNEEGSQSEQKMKPITDPKTKKSYNLEDGIDSVWMRYYNR